jgi:hypothetical protein
MMSAPKIVLIPTFLLHPDAEAVLLEAAAWPLHVERFGGGRQ